MVVVRSFRGPCTSPRIRDFFQIGSSGLYCSHTSSIWIPLRRAAFNILSNSVSDTTCERAVCCCLNSTLALKRISRGKEIVDRRSEITQSMSVETKSRSPMRNHACATETAKIRVCLNQHFFLRQLIPNLHSSLSSTVLTLGIE